MPSQRKPGASPRGRATVSASSELPAGPPPELHILSGGPPGASEAARTDGATPPHPLAAPAAGRSGGAGRRPTRESVDFWAGLLGWCVGLLSVQIAIAAAGDDEELAEALALTKEEAEGISRWPAKKLAATQLGKRLGRHLADPDLRATAAALQSYGARVGPLLAARAMQSWAERPARPVRPKSAPHAQRPTVRPSGEPVRPEPLPIIGTPGAGLSGAYAVS